MPRSALGWVSMAGRTHPYQGHSFRHPSRPQRCHKGPRLVSSRRRTCAGRKHRPRWDQADRRQLCALAGAPDGWSVACAADSPWPPPAIHAPSADQHCRTCHDHYGSSRNHAAVFRPALYRAAQPSGPFRRLSPLAAPRMPAASSGFEERSASAAIRALASVSQAGGRSGPVRLLVGADAATSPPQAPRTPGVLTSCGRAQPPRRAVQPHRRCRGRARRLQLM